MVATGAVIYGADYNAVQLKVIQVLGTGSPYGPGTASPNYGYNQTVTSSAVAVSAIITHSQFQLLADDINKCTVHQTNANFVGYSTNFGAVGATITAADLNTLDTQINTCITNRITAAAAQLVSAATSYTRTTAWGGGATGITQTGTITFASATAAQYFFNQGGSVVFTGFFNTPSATTQDVTWTTLARAFTYTVNSAVYVGLTTTATQKYLTYSGTSPYTGNYIQLLLSSNGAGVITYTIYYQDNHAAAGAGPDSVSGTIGFTLTRYTSTGVIVGTAPTIAVTAGSTFV